MRVLNVQGLTSHNTPLHLCTKLVVPSIGSMIQVGLSVRMLGAPAATDSSPMKLEEEGEEGKCIRDQIHLRQTYRGEGYLFKTSVSV